MGNVDDEHPSKVLIPSGGDNARYGAKGTDHEGINVVGVGHPHH